MIEPIKLKNLVKYQDSPRSKLFLSLEIKLKILLPFKFNRILLIFSRKNSLSAIFAQVKLKVPITFTICFVKIVENLTTQSGHRPVIYKENLHS